MLNSEYLLSIWISFLEIMFVAVKVTERPVLELECLTLRHIHSRQHLLATNKSQGHMVRY